MKPWAHLLKFVSVLEGQTCLRGEEYNVTTEPCTPPIPSSKCMGKIQYFFADSAQNIFHCFLPKQNRLVWHTLTNSFLADIFQPFFSLLIFHTCMGGVLMAIQTCSARKKLLHGRCINLHYTFKNCKWQCILEFQSDFKSLGNFSLNFYSEKTC